MPNDLNGADKIAERTEDNLLALVGYAEIEKASKVSRSTIERAWRGPWDDGEPQFRKPGKIGSRSLWTAGDVNDWLLARARWQTGVITNLARVSVDDLEPEQLEDQALDLAAQALSKRTGISVDPQDVSLHLMQRLTGDDFIALQTQEHSGRAAYLAQLPVDQAVVVAATLLPQLRPALMAAASPRAREGMNDPSLLEMDFRFISDFLTVFELGTRLTANGMQLPSGQTALERLAEFDQARAFVLSAWLFPELLPFFLHSVKPAAHDLFANPDLLHEAAMAALDDDKWAKKQTELLARERGTPPRTRRRPPNKPHSETPPPTTFK